MSTINSDPPKSAASRPVDSFDFIAQADVGVQLSPAPAGRRRSSVRYAVQVLLTSLPLAVADVLALLGSVFLAGELFGLLAFRGESHSLSQLLSFSAAFVFLNILCGRYPAVGQHPVAEFRQGSISTTLVYLVFLPAPFILGQITVANQCLYAVAWLFSMVSVPLLRSVARALFSRYHWWGQPALIFGAGNQADAVYHALKSNPRRGLRPVGIVAEFPLRRRNGVSDSSAYPGPPALAATIASAHGAFWAVIAMPDRAKVEVLELMDACAHMLPHIVLIPDMRGLPTLWNRAHDCAGLPAFKLRHSLLLPLPRLTKRVIDLTLAILAGLLSLPIIALIALLIKIDSPGPVFYKHERIGRNGRRFSLWKFRTMVADADKLLHQCLLFDPQLREEWNNDHKLTNDPRATRIGRWLRRTSLDELPQLGNVIRGEMSLVGPRPIVEAEIIKYQGSYELYAKVLPGITGLWQVSGRNNTTYPQRVEFDCYYIRNWSVWMDLYILAQTVAVVLQRTGAR